MCDPDWYALKRDVHNKWDDNTHTHTKQNEDKRQDEPGWIQLNFVTLSLGPDGGQHYYINKCTMIITILAIKQITVTD